MADEHEKVGDHDEVGESVNDAAFGAGAGSATETDAELGEAVAESISGVTGDAVPEHDGAPTRAEAAIELANQLFDLARQNRASELAPYLEAGAPVNMQNAKGDTMLTLAAYHGASEVVELLLRHGADVEATNDRGQRALAGAVFKQDAATTRILLAAGADPDGGTPTPRATAEMFGWPEFETLLAERR